MRLKVERLDTFWPDADSLMAAHWAEVGHQHNRPYKFALEQAKKIDAAGVSVICTGRTINGEMVGYCIFYLSENIVSEGSLCATQCGWFVDRAWRSLGVGLKLFRFAIEELKRRGVRDVYPHYWVGREDSGIIGEWFKKLGAEPMENVFHLRLGE